MIVVVLLLLFSTSSTSSSSVHWGYFRFFKFFVLFNALGAFSLRSCSFFNCTFSSHKLATGCLVAPGFLLYNSMLNTAGLSTLKMSVVIIIAANSC